MIKMNLQLFGGRGSGSGKAISENLAKKLAFTDYADRNQISNKDIEDIYGEYQYHATTSKAVFQIYEQGLIPNRGHAGKGVYFAPSEQSAFDWTEYTSTGGKFPMRVKTSSLYKNYKWDDIDGTESYAKTKIKSKDIEVKLGHSWVSMQEFVERRPASYNMWRRMKK